MNANAEPSAQQKDTGCLEKYNWTWDSFNTLPDVAE